MKKFFLVGALVALLGAPTVLHAFWWGGGFIIATQGGRNGSLSKRPDAQERAQRQAEIRRNPTKLCEPFKISNNNHVLNGLTVDIVWRENNVKRGGMSWSSELVIESVYDNGVVTAVYGRRGSKSGGDSWCVRVRGNIIENGSKMHFAFHRNIRRYPERCGFMELSLSADRSRVDKAIYKVPKIFWRLRPCPWPAAEFSGSITLHKTLHK